MKGTKSKYMAAIMMLALALGSASSVAAVDSANTDVEITQPVENGSDDLSMISPGITYNYDLSVDSADNNTTVDTKLTLTDSDGNNYTAWENNTAVDSGETVTVTGSSGFGDYGLPDNSSNEDVTLAAEATFTDDTDGTTATESDSVGFTVTEGSFFNAIMVLIGLSIGAAFVKEQN